MQTIIIQETDKDIREVLQMAIEPEGYRVVAVAEPGPSLLRLVGLEKPGLVILDFKLTGEPCIKMHRMIKQHWPKLPVLAISCNSKIKNFYRRYGFDGFIEKPFDIGHLILVIRQHILPEPGLTAIAYRGLSMNL